MGTAVKLTRLANFPIHTRISGAMPVETMVSPLANSNEEYAPMNFKGGRVVSLLLTKDLVAPESTRARTGVPYTTAFTTISKWS